MSSLACVTIHSSQFPENIRRALLDSLRDRRINHKFHYDSFKQTQKWLALHECFSPSRNDPCCATAYDRSFASAARCFDASRVHVIGLGCGGGQKDTRLLELFRTEGRDVFYTPCDVSVSMVLVARRAALAAVPEEKCFPFACDLAAAEGLRDSFTKQTPQDAVRLLTFFGMIPNFEPQIILPKLAGLVGANDWLLFSANLAPGDDVEGGMKRILPQYDNALTRDWLMTFLLDLGVESNDGELQFRIEDGELGLKRVVARFHFGRERKLQIGSEEFIFGADTSIRLFFSYRYTPAMARNALARFGIEVIQDWITQSEEEGIFLCRRKP